MPATFEGVAETVVQDGPVRVTLEWIGEGLSGDYDPTDPHDEPMMRFYVEAYTDETYDPYDNLNIMHPENGSSGEWFDVEEGSCCTYIRADKPEHHKDYAEKILAAVYPKLVTPNRESIKKLCEELSWYGNGMYDYHDEAE